MKSNTTKKKSHKKLWIILGIIAVVVIGLITLGVHAVKNMADAMTEAMSGNTATVEKGSIEVITEGNGVVETTKSTTEDIAYNVTLRHLYKQNGEVVKAGEVIAEFDGAALDESLSALEQQLETVDAQIKSASKDGKTTVTAPAAGRVKQIWAKEGESVQMTQNTNPGLVEIAADGRLKVEVETQTQVTTGQEVTVVYGEEKIDGLVEEVKGTNVTVTFADSEKYEVNADVTVLTKEEASIGSGKVVCNQSVYALADSGTVKNISVKINDKVSAGATLVKLENTGYSVSYLSLLEQRQQLADKVEKAKEYRKGYVITAKTDGIIGEMTAKEGDILPAGTVFGKVMDTSAYQVVLTIDELDIQGIEPGQQVEVTVDALEDMIIEGTVSNVSLTGQNENGVAGYQVSVVLSDAKGVLPGMSANGKITVDNHTDTLMVPVDALQTKDGKKTVTVVKKDGTTEEREVTVGLVNNENAEILEGVTEGESVQIIMKLEDIYSQMGITVEETEE